MSALLPDIVQRIVFENSDSNRAIADTTTRLSAMHREVDSGAGKWSNYETTQRSTGNAFSETTAKLSGLHSEVESGSRSWSTYETTTMKASEATRGLERDAKGAESALRRHGTTADNVGKSIRNLGNDHEDTGRRVGALGRIMEGLVVHFTNSSRGATATGEASKGASGGFSLLSSAGSSLIDHFKNLNTVFEAFSNIVELIKIPAMIAAIGPAAQGIVALAGGAMELVSALTPLVGLLGALPGLLIGAAFGAGALMLAFQGVTEAIGAGLQAQADGGQAARNRAEQEISSAQSIENATHGIAQAKVALMHAEEQAADSIDNANKRVADSERNLQRAEQDETLTQENLSLARRDAARALEDLTMQSKRAEIQQEEASLRLADSQKALDQLQKGLNNQTVASTGNAAIDALNQQLKTSYQQTVVSEQVKKAQLDVKSAQLDVQDAQTQAKRTQEDLTLAEQKGVEGSRAVVEAKRAEADAVYNVANAQREQTLAVRDLQRTYRDTKIAVDEANYNLGQAAQSLENAERQARNLALTLTPLQQAMRQLGPAGQEFVNFILGLIPKFRELQNIAQEGLFGPIEKGIQDLVNGPFWGELKKIIGEVSAAIGGFIQKFLDLISSPAFTTMLDKVMGSNIKAFQTFTDGVLKFVDVFMRIAVAAGPLVEHLADLFDRWATSIDNALSSAGGTQKLSDFFDKVMTVTDQWLDVLGNVWQIFSGINKVAQEFALGPNGMLASLQKITQSWADWVNSGPGQDRIRKFFADIQPILHEMGALLGAVVKMFFDLASPPGGPKKGGLADLLHQVRVELLPVIEKLLQSAGSGGFLSKIIDLLASVGKVFATLAGQGGALNLFVGLVKDLVDAFGGFLKIPGVAPIIASLVLGMKGFQTLKLVSNVTGLTGAFKGVLNAYDGFITQMSGREKQLQGIGGRIGDLLGKLTPGSRARRAGTEAADDAEQAAPSIIGKIKGLFGRKGGKAAEEAAEDAPWGNLEKMALQQEGRLKPIAARIKKLFTGGGDEAGSMGLGMFGKLKDVFDKIGGSKIGGLMSKLGPAIQMAAVASWEFTASLLANPLTWIVIGVVALVAGLVLLYQHWKPFRELIDNFVKGLKMIGEWVLGHWKLIVGILLGPIAFIILNFNTVKKVALEVFHAIGDVVSWVWESVIKPVFGFIVGVIKKFYETELKILETVWRAVFGAIQTVLSTAWNVVSGIFNAIVGFIRGAWTDGVRFIGQVWGEVWGGIKDGLSTAWGFISGIFNTIVGFIRGTLLGVFREIGSVWHDVWDGIKSFFSTVWDDITKGLKTGIHALGQLISGVLHVIGGVMQHIPLLGGIGSTISGWGDDAAGWGAASGMQLVAAPGPFQRIGSGFRTAGPRAVVGEGNPAYPEFVVPTDPIYRNRAMGLFRQLGEQLGAFNKAHGGQVGLGLAGGIGLHTITDVAGDIWDTITTPLQIAANVAEAIAKKGLAWVLEHGWPKFDVDKDSILSFIPGMFNTFRSDAINWLTGDNPGGQDATSKPATSGGSGPRAHLMAAGGILGRGLQGGGIIDSIRRQMDPLRLFGTPSPGWSYGGGSKMSVPSPWYPGTHSPIENWPAFDPTRFGAGPSVSLGGGTSHAVSIERGAVQVIIQGNPDERTIALVEARLAGVLQDLTGMRRQGTRSVR